MEDRAQVDQWLEYAASFQNCEDNIKDNLLTVSTILLTGLISCLILIVVV